MSLRSKLLLSLTLLALVPLILFGITAYLSATSSLVNVSGENLTSLTNLEQSNLASLNKAQQGNLTALDKVQQDNLSSVIAVERDNLTAAAGSVNRALADIESVLSHNVADNANWDDIHKAIATDPPDQDFFKTNFDPSIPTSTANTF